VTSEGIITGGDTGPAEGLEGVGDRPGWACEVSGEGGIDGFSPEKKEGDILFRRPAEKRGGTIHP